MKIKSLLLSARAKTPSVGSWGSKRSKGPKSPSVSSSSLQSDSGESIKSDFGCCNGFSTVTDQVTLQIDATNIAPFSLPQEALSLVPDDEQIVRSFSKGDTVRLLHCNVELSSQELEKLQVMQEEAEAQGKAFLPSLTSSALRYLAHAKGDPKLAVKLMQNTQDWKQDFFSAPIRDADIIEDMKHGIAYWVGRDSTLRPTLVLRVKRIPPAWTKSGNFDSVIRLALFCVEYYMRYMVVPGRVECFNVLVDLKDVSLSQIPVSALRELQSKFGNHYVGRGGTFFVCNMSWLLSPLVSIAKTVLSERQNQKLAFISKVTDLQKYFALHQLEQDLGGTMPIVTEFFPFPLQPGPFNAGFSGGARTDATPDVYKIFNAAGARGRLWDKLKSVEENTRLEYSKVAPDILRSCGLPVPVIVPEASQEPADDGRLSMASDAFADDANADGEGGNKDVLAGEADNKLGREEPSVLFIKGDRVIVLASFQPFRDSTYELKEGCKGVINEVDIVGDAFITFTSQDGVKLRLWIFKSCLRYLKILGEGQRITFEFSGELGMQFESSTGRVTKLCDGLALRKGVQVGWRILSVDQSPYKSDLMKFDMALEKPRQITFLQDCAQCLSPVTDGPIGTRTEQWLTASELRDKYVLL